jgi:RHS repeat-associated protein
MEPAQSQAFSESLLAAMPQLREKPHLGVPSSNPALYLGHEVCNSTTALGLRAALHLERIRSRSTGKERDAESGNDYFDARYYGSSMGRFLSADSGEDQDVEDPQSWNLYS